MDCQCPQHMCPQHVCPQHVCLRRPLAPTFAVCVLNFPSSYTLPSEQATCSENQQEDWIERTRGTQPPLPF